MACVNSCVFFDLFFEMIRNYKKLNNDPDHNFLICKEICQKIVESAKIQLEIVQKEAFPKLENFLLVSNHRCFLMWFFYWQQLKIQLVLWRRKSFWHYPILSRYLIQLGVWHSNGEQKTGNDKKQYCFHASGTCQGKSCLISGRRMQLLR